MTFHCGWHLRNCSSYKDLEWIEIAFKITHERFLVVRRTYWLSSWKYPGYLGPLHVIKQIHPFHILRSSRYQRISKQMQTWSTMQSLAPCCEQDTKTPVATHIPISLYHYTSPSHQSTRLPQNISSIRYAGVHSLSISYLKYLIWGELATTLTKSSVASLHL